MDRARASIDLECEAEWPSRGPLLRITEEEIARAARELVHAYGPAAIKLMQNRTRAVRRRGDTESATLWLAVAEAVKEQLAASDKVEPAGGTAD